MKLQVAVDKLFSHKLFSNKYFLYAVVAASVLTNYMRVVDCHYEVVGFFILVGIIMMNFSKNVAVVLTVCLLLTQIIMAGKAIREGLDNMPKKHNNHLQKYMTPEQLKLFKQALANRQEVNKKIANKNIKLSTTNAKITDANATISAAKNKNIVNNAAYAVAKTALSNASSTEKKYKKHAVDIAKNALKQSEDNLAAATAKLEKNTKIKTDIEAEIALHTTDKDNINKQIKEIKTVARAAAAKAKADAEAAAAAAKAKAEADAKAKADADAAKSDTKQGIKSELSQKKKEERAVSRVAKAAAAKAAAKPRLGPGPQMHLRDRFALLSDSDNDSDNDNDMDYENNGIDFLEPTKLTDITQGTTNLMTKQKDLFSFMNSMTPLIDNAKKMLGGLDLTKLRA